MIQNCVHYGKNYPRQEVEDGYNFVNVFAKNLTIIPINFFVALFFGLTEVIGDFFQTNIIRLLSVWGCELTHANIQSILEPSYYLQSSLTLVINCSQLSRDSLRESIIVKCVIQTLLTSLFLLSLLERITSWVYFSQLYPLIVQN